MCGPTANGTKFMLQTLMSNAVNKAVQLRAVLVSMVTKVEVPKCRSSPSIRQIGTVFQIYIDPISSIKLVNKYTYSLWSSSLSSPNPRPSRKLGVF